MILETEEVPVSYPMPRSPRCPFDPPSELLELCSDEPIMRVKIWDGSTPWLVTRYTEFNRDDAVGIGEILYIGAYVTMASTVGLGTFLLLQNPDQARLIREGDEATSFAAVDELLRYLTVNHMGRHLARIELQIAFSLLRTFPTMRLAVPPEDVDVRKHHVIYGVHSLPVEW
jgi:cytochrome P450